MATLADNATKLTADLAALSDDFDTLETAVTRLKAAMPAVGTTVDQATVDAIQGATDGFDALVAKIAAANAA